MKSTLPVAIIAAGAIVAAAIYISMGGNFAFGNSSTNTDNPALVRPVDVSDHILGNPAAPVKIVEYADFDCEYCRSFSNTLHEIIANEGIKGQVAWVYREFPLTTLHPNALAAARAAECAAKTGGNDVFWRFADLLFANQPADPSTFGDLAASAGAPADAFASCYADAANQVDARIEADSSNAKAVGAEGTPYSLLLAPGAAPIVLDGAYTYDALKQLVDQAVAKSR